MLNPEGTKNNILTVKLIQTCSFILLTYQYSDKRHRRLRDGVLVYTAKRLGNQLMFHEHEHTARDWRPTWLRI